MPVSFKVRLIGLLALILVPVSAVRGNEAAAASETLASDFINHWQSADAGALAGLWAEDGDWMSITGSRRVVTGRERMVGLWQIGLQGRDTAAKRAIEIEVTTATMLADDIISTDWRVLYGTPATGTVDEAMFLVLVKEGEGWRIRTCRVARIGATAPAAN